MTSSTSPPLLYKESLKMALDIRKWRGSPKRCGSLSLCLHVLGRRRWASGKKAGSAAKPLRRVLCLQEALKCKGRLPPFNLVQRSVERRSRCGRANANATKKITSIKGLKSSLSFYSRELIAKGKGFFLGFDNEKPLPVVQVCKHFSHRYL